MKRILIRISKILGILIIILYVSACALFYFNQEKLGFRPDKLSTDYVYDYAGNFQEVNLKTPDGININNLLFKADSSRGVILYLHGNGGSLSDIGKYAEFYTSLDYDVFMADYRGYGKSEGSINSEPQLHQDNQMIYDELKKIYSEDKIIVIGYSLGGALATKLASNNNPRYLVLQAPYCGTKGYNIWPDEEPPLIMKMFRLMPMKLLMKYTLKTNEFIQNCNMPVLIFHGTEDNVIPTGSSIKLKEDFKSEDRLIILEDEDHLDIGNNQVYQKEIQKLLGI